LQALDAYRTALGLSDPARDQVGYADALLNMAEGYLLVGQHSNALDYYRRALEAGAPVTGEHGQAVLEHMSRAALEAGAYDTAAQMLQAALDAVDRAPDPTGGRGRIERMARRAQILDQLALTHYLKQDYAPAADFCRRTGEAVSELIEADPAGGAGYRRNLLRARRQEAVNIYYAVQAGRRPAADLQRAWDLLQGVLKDLDRVGVIERESSSPGIITIDIQVAVGAQTSPGRFDRDAERRLAFAFLARIAEEAGDHATAAAMTEKRLALYPQPRKSAEVLDQWAERATVWSQLGAYRAAAGDLRGAAEAFTKALDMNARAGNLQGRMASCRSLGRVALRMAAEPPERRGMTDKEWKAWLREVAGRHRELLAEADRQAAAYLAEPALGLSTGLAELAPYIAD
jgi:tetratricopeptide (TPR) repeat protein